jgi:hypothetical protein
MRFGLIPREGRGTSGLLAFEFLEFFFEMWVLVFEPGVFGFERRVCEFEFLDALDQVSDETDQFSLTELIEVRAGWHVRILRLKADQQHRNPHTMRISNYIFIQWLDSDCFYLYGFVFSFFLRRNYGFK